MILDSYYEPLGGHRFRSTPATSGPWDDRLQHGGPPAALVIRALENLDPQRLDMRISRVTVDILSPVPVGDVTVRARVIRGGRQVELLEGALDAAGKEVLRVTAWRIATLPGSVPAVPDPGEPPPPLPPPRKQEPSADWPPGTRTEGLISSVDWRYTGNPPRTPGPAQVWARPTPTLVAGEKTTGIERLLILTDSGHGLSAVLDPQQWLFINTDLTLLVHRHPIGEWTFLEARTMIDPDGTGMAETHLSDERGRIGRCLQTLLVTPRR